MKLLTITIALFLATFHCIAQSVQAESMLEGQQPRPSFAAAHPVAAMPTEPSEASATPAIVRTDNTVLTDADLRALLAGEQLGTGENERVYIVRTNPLEYRKVAWLPWRRASYTLNVPPGGSLIHLRATESRETRGVTVQGLQNATEDWMHVTAMVSGAHIDIVAPASTAMRTLFDIEDLRALDAVVR